MLRLRQPQLSLADGILPEELRRLSDELAEVDRVLEDDRFMAPFLERFDEAIGRPTVPVEQYLRLMFLKYRYRMGYETLVREVSDSIHWRLFCRIPLDANVPHFTTLIKLTRKYGAETIADVNELLVRKLTEEKLLRGRKLRTDTTVMAANVEHPTDADLVNDGVNLINRVAKQAGKVVTGVRDGIRSGVRVAVAILWAIGAALKSRALDSLEKVDKLTAKMAGVGEQAVRGGQKVLDRLQYAAQSVSEAAAKKVEVVRRKLQDAVDVTRRVLEQTQQRLKGVTAIPDRLVSLHDRDARPIRRGKLSRPTEFGYKVLITEAEEGVVTHYQVHKGNPADSSMLVPTVKRHVELFGQAPDEVAGDKGFTSSENERQLKSLGVKRVSLPIRGRRSQRRDMVERSGWFRRLQRWRTGCEATISTLKRKHQLDRNYLPGQDGADVWTGLSVFAHNLGRPRVIKAKRAAAAKAAAARQTAQAGARGVKHAA